MASGEVPRVTSVAADNRGRVVLQLNCPISPFAFSSSPAQVTTAGPDGTFETADDVAVQTDTIRLEGNDAIEVNADIAANEPYRFVLESNLVRSLSGGALDGEFNGMGIESGDGSAGGDFVFFTRPPATVIARFTTVSGIIDVELFPGATPATVENFFDYANDGDWDGTMFHRSVENFVIQGGGFMAEADFGEVPERDPLVNEPGISNVRGTLAMAKLPNDPDSATNQWFFNLGDNSANLDNQNGGFTVFGEIMDGDGLLVMDRVGALPTVDASDVDGAFGDLPVRDLQAFEDRGEMLIPEDVVEITRVAILQDIASEPTVSFNTDNAVIERPDVGDAEVMIFDVAGESLPGGLLDVRFSRDGDSVASVVLREEIPTNRDVAISISSERPVGRILDRRRDPGEIMFIHSETGINSINLRGGISGANINGIRLPDGSTLPVDIDADGSGSDPTAIIIQSGELRRVNIRGDLRGDVIAPIAPRSIVVRGDVSECSMVFEQSEDRRALRVRVGRARDFRINTPGELRSLRATEILTSSATSPSRVIASRLGVIATTGDRRNGIEGDFECDLMTTGGDDGSFGRAIRALRVAGDIRNAAFDFDQDVFARLVARGDVIDSTIAVDGILNGGLSGGQIFRTDITVTGAMGPLIASQVAGGSIVADTLRSIRVRGDRRAELDGDFSMDLTINNSAGDRRALGRIFVKGDFLDSVVTISGATNSVLVRGDVEGVTFDQQGELRSWRADRVRDTDLTIDDRCRLISCTDWQGGSIMADDVTVFNANGDRREGIPGDLRTEVEMDNVNSFRLRNGGSLDATSVTIQTVRSMVIDGDVIDSEILLDILQTNDTFEVIAANSLRIGGDMFRSDIRTLEAINRIEIGRLVDSNIILGAGSVTAEGFPPGAENVAENANLNTIIINPRRDGVGFVNSFVICADLGNAFITEPRTDNVSGENGLSYTNLRGVVSLMLDGQLLRLTELDGSFRSEDFQVRSFHQPPELP